MTGNHLSRRTFRGLTGGTATWNEFLFALILLNSDANKTIPVGLLNFQGQFSNNSTGLAAGATKG